MKETRENIEEFVRKFQSFEGCLEIIQNEEGGQILSTVSELTGIPPENLGNLKADTLGSYNKKTSYHNVLKILGKTAVCFRDLYKDLYDEKSRHNLFSIIKYWLIPDRDFLKESFSQNTTQVKDGLYADKPCFIIYNSDEIKEHIDEIIGMKSGDYFLYEPESFLHDITSAYLLISALRKDISFDLQMTDAEHIFLSCYTPVPKIKKLMKKHNRLHVVSMAKNPGAWKNEELLKDKGLVPYFLYKDYNYSSKMVGADNGDYPYLEKYLQGLELEFLEM